MDKKYRAISLFCGICGIVAGLLMLVAAFMEEAFPLPLRLVMAICFVLNGISAVLNFWNIRKQKNADVPEESK